MAYGVFGVPSFGGLNLAEPDEVGPQGAIDLKNVTFDRAGAVRTRDGYAAFSAVGALTDYMEWVSADYLIANVNALTYAISPAGATIASSGKSTGSAVTIGTPTTTAMYAGQGGVMGTALQKFNGSAWSTVGSYNSRYVAVTPWDNRLVLGYTNEVAGGPFVSRVRFSDPGAPETFTANSYIDVTPGDGESISGVITWREFLFVFKQTKYFVFYGTDTDATGAPIFRYRTVDSGVGTEAFGYAAGPRVAKADDGVYFHSRAGRFQQGCYRTTGGTPEKISGPLDRYLQGETIPFCNLTAIGDRTLFPATHGSLILWSIGAVSGASGSAGTLVYHRATGQWSYWSLSGPYASFVNTTTGVLTLLLVPSAASTSIFQSRSTDTTDAGSGITAYYQSGFYDLGLPGREKTIRETLLTGKGNVSLKIARDASTTYDTASTVALGSSTSINRRRTAVRGTMFSHRLADVSGAAWTVDRLDHHVRRPRDPGPHSS